MIKIITRLFKKPENKLLNQLNEIDELKQTVESSYAREDMMRDEYKKTKTALEFKIAINEQYSKQNQILLQKVADLENQLYKQILLNNELLSKLSNK